MKMLLVMLEIFIVYIPMSVSILYLLFGIMLIMLNAEIRTRMLTSLLAFIEILIVIMYIKYNVVYLPELALESFIVMVSIVTNIRDVKTKCTNKRKKRY